MATVDGPAVVGSGSPFMRDGSPSRSRSRTTSLRAAREACVVTALSAKDLSPYMLVHEALTQAVMQIARRFGLRCRVKGAVMEENIDHSFIGIWPDLAGEAHNSADRSS
jgi:hypothetical protein